MIDNITLLQTCFFSAIKDQCYPIMIWYSYLTWLNRRSIYPRQDLSSKTVTICLQYIPNICPMPFPCPIKLSPHVRKNIRFDTSPIQQISRSGERPRITSTHVLNVSAQLARSACEQKAAENAIMPPRE